MIETTEFGRRYPERSPLRHLQFRAKITEARYVYLMGAAVLRLRIEETSTHNSAIITYFAAARDTARITKHGQELVRVVDDWRTKYLDNGVLKYSEQWHFIKHLEHLGVHRKGTTLRWLEGLDITWSWALCYDEPPLAGEHRRLLVPVKVHYPQPEHDICSRCFRLTDEWCDWGWCEVCWNDEGHNLIVITARQDGDDPTPMLEEWHRSNRTLKDAMRKEDR